MKERDVIYTSIETWSENRTVDEVCTILKEHDIPCAPIYSTRNVTEDPHISQHRNMFIKYIQPEIGDVTVTNIPVRFHSTNTPPLFPAPLLGEHSEDIPKNI